MSDPMLMFRRVHCVGKSSAMRFYLPCTLQVADADDGHNDAVQDIAMGGVVLMDLISYNQSAATGDWLVCRPDGANSDGSGDLKVAVEPQLQSRITSQTLPDGSTWTAISYDASLQSRSVVNGSTTLTEYITPPFVTSPRNRIPVSYCGNTGVTVGGVVLTLIAITGRQWASG